MAIVTPIRLESVACNVDFSGGDISSDAGCLLLSELIVKLRLKEALHKHLLSHPLRTRGRPTYSRRVQNNTGLVFIPGIFVESSPSRML